MERKKLKIYCGKGFPIYTKTAGLDTHHGVPSPETSFSKWENKRRKGNLGFSICQYRFKFLFNF